MKEILVSHNMNEVSDYYQGEDGVFYDFKHDEIFELEFRGKEIGRIVDRRFIIVGKYYAQYQSLTDIHRVTDRTAITGMDNVIRLGDL